MSGGQLVVLDRAGRDVKRFPLAEGLATLGSDPACDIRIMLPTVDPHHATVVVRAQQTLVRKMSSGDTLVNGSCVSVAALRHGDVIGIGGRRLRWEYTDPATPRPLAPQPALYVSRRKTRGPRRASGQAGVQRDRALQLALEMSHRASMPASAGGKQVAIVQPQRRDTSDQIAASPAAASRAAASPAAASRAAASSAAASRAAASPAAASPAGAEPAKRKASARHSPKAAMATLHNTTKATLWIESRKTSPRKSSKASPTPEQVVRARRTTISAKKSTPLRLTVLKRAQSAQKMRVTKIQAPLKMDHTKQAALLLMSGRGRASLALDKWRHSGAAVAAARNYTSTRKSAADRTVTILEITDSDGRNASLRSNASRPSGHKSPRKSALKDPAAKRGARKAESIKFDLSNLDGCSMAGDSLRYSESPSPRRPLRAFRTRTLSPRTPRNDLESYSIVDLVSMDTDDSGRSASVYGSAGSVGDTTFGTPQTSTGRKTRSTIDPALLQGSSTPYVKGRSSTPRSRSNPSLGTSSRASLNSTRSSNRRSKPRRTKSLSTPENTEEAKKHISVNSTRMSRASRSRSRINDSDLLLLDDDDDSPRTSKRISTTSTRSSVRTGVNTTNVTPTTSTQNEGICTPENRHSPEEASTPVLSIQSLLDSSQSSLTSQKPTRNGRFTFNVKRKTIGVASGPKTRVGAKSKSMSFSARKTRLRLSSDSVEVINTNDDGEIVTPKSAVKLVQEGVKNKHSTAKKPQSKRSIIDDLNESDIVKQLFNSPVKRKLSQSMTEFSRAQLDGSPELSASCSPAMAVSPLSSRSASPDPASPDPASPDPASPDPASPDPASPDPASLDPASSTPQAERRTPRARRSIKNDLTNVSGVKNVFAKSPRNRLSDVRVKDVFAASPTDDLRRVSGVKMLFRNAEQRKSPRNELDDVRGVKKLFNRKSAANDLRNVSGVKRTLRRNSPNNDLSDVRGVKRMFARERRNDLNDVSGVEELFNLSNYSNATVSSKAESLFDQLIGKPPIKAVYSKTFSTKIHKSKSPKSKTLHASLDQITSADGWLEQELNKRLQIKNYLDSLNTANTFKANRSKSNKSKSLNASVDEITFADDEQVPNKEQTTRSPNSSRSKRSRANKSRANQSKVNKSRADTSKANLSRELQKLATHTVEGNTPLRTSRVRNSTIEKSYLERKKSASELYSAHTLPIKKRSLVESVEKEDNNKSGRSLPLKKRALPHSTPLKGRPSALDASAVSPIARHSGTFTQPKETTEAKPKSTRGRKTSVENVPIFPEFVKSSPKKTRGRAKVTSPKAKPARPAKQKASAKGKKASPAKAKKASPVKPKKATSAKIIASPVPAKTTRSRRNVSIPESNTKKHTTTLVVAKKSPVMSPKPKATRKRKEPDTPTPKPSPKKTRNIRKANESVKDKPNNTPKTTRAKVQKATVVVGKPSPQLKPRATRKTQVTEAKQETRKTRKTVTLQVTKPESPKKSQIQIKSPEAPTTRRRKTANVSNDITEEKPKAKRGRKTNESNKNIKNKSETSIVEKPVRTRGKKVESQASVESENTRSKRTTKPDTAEVKTTRKRKTTAPDNEIPPKVRKTKGVPEKARKNMTEVNGTGNAKKSVAKQSKVESNSEVPVKSTRGRKAQQADLAKDAGQKVARGRKANIEVLPADQTTGKRKRGAATEPSPVPERSKKQRGGKKLSAVSPVKETRTRATRGNTQAEGKPAGRGRRR